MTPTPPTPPPSSYEAPTCDEHRLPGLKALADVLARSVAERRQP
ncbi:hypothetical protein [Streptomyces sp. yr375]|nr:hypothetical protein [Streptomyces sp. yr375]